MKKRNSESLDPFAHYFDMNNDALLTPPCKSTVPHTDRFTPQTEKEAEDNGCAMQNYNTSI